jgi:hypothetical protein
MRDLGLPATWAPRLLSVLRIVAALIFMGPWSLDARPDSGGRR